MLKREVDLVKFTEYQRTKGHKKLKIPASLASESDQFHATSSHRTGNNKMSRSRLQRQDPNLFNVSEESREENENERTNNFFHMSIRDESQIINPRMRQLKSARDAYLMNKED